MEHVGVYTRISLFFLVPFSIIAFCYIRVWMTIKRWSLTGYHQDLRLFLGVTAGCFLCFAPYNIMLFIESLMIQGIRLYTGGWGEAMFYISHVLVSLHCCLSPLVHEFGVERFQRHFFAHTASSQKRSDSKLQFNGKQLSTSCCLPTDDCVN